MKRDSKMIRNFLDKYTHKCSEAVASQQEVSILSGCHRCGKRLVENDKPIEGAAIVRHPLELVGRPYCGECLKDGV